MIVTPKGFLGRFAAGAECGLGWVSSCRFLVLTVSAGLLSGASSGFVTSVSF